MANRISSQNSVLRTTLLSDKCSYANKDKSRAMKMGSSRSTALNKSLQKQNFTSYACWNYSPLKNRKLPRLVGKN